MATLTRRQVLQASCLLMLPTLSACGKSGGTVLDVVLYSFIPRPIFDIFLSGHPLGVASPYGGTSIVTSVWLPYGAQKLTWRLDGPEGTEGNGDTVSLKNSIVIQPQQIPKDSIYMGIYLYPDNTAEVVFSKHIPGNSKRGESILKSRHGDMTGNE